MQRALRKAFGSKTVIAIAHHLQTILDFDRVFVLDKGEIIESGSPKELLDTSGSVFKSLAESMNSPVGSPSEPKNEVHE